MKVIHLESGRHLYGGAKQVVLLLQGLNVLPTEHLQEHILVCPNDSAIAAAAQALAIRHITIPMRGDLDPRLMTRLKAILRQYKPNLLHIHSRRGADIWGALAARAVGIPVVLSRRVDNPEQRWLARLKYPLYQKVITISQGISQVLVNQMNIPAEKIVCVHSAIDTEEYHPGGDKDWLKLSFGLPDNAYVIGMVSQFIERKGHRILLQALPEVITQHPQTHVVLFGHGPLEQAMQQLCIQLQLEKYVTFAGFRNDLARIIPALDLVVHPASREGLGVALLQAAACGIPIVAGRAGGIPEIVHDGVNGLLVPPNDAKALTLAINNLLADPKQAARFGQAGRRIVEQNFSLAQMVQGNYQVYAELLAANKQHLIS